MPAARLARHVPPDAGTAQASSLANQRVEKSILIVRCGVGRRQDLAAVMDDLRRKYGYFAQRAGRVGDELRDACLALVAEYRAGRVQQQAARGEQRPKCCED